MDNKHLCVDHPYSKCSNIEYRNCCWTLDVYLHVFFFDRANSIKTNLQTCNLQNIQSISYKSIKQFWLNLPYPNSKTFSTSNIKNNPNLQIDIFCHFDFSHSRRNAFCQSRLELFASKSNLCTPKCWILVLRNFRYCTWDCTWYRNVQNQGQISQCADLPKWIRT